MEYHVKIITWEPMGSLARNFDFSSQENARVDYQNSEMYEVLSSIHAIAGSFSLRKNEWKYIRSLLAQNTSLCGAENIAEMWGRKRVVSLLPQAS